MPEQDFKKFYESINSELNSTKDRVRNLIGDANWVADGSYKEAILKNIISKFLPKNYSISSGFIINPDRKITKQIDIIVYDDSSPILFKEGDFAIVLAHTVKGIIEVKTNIKNWSELRKFIKTANENGKIIETILTKHKFLFNGIFSYETGFNLDDSLKQKLKKSIFNLGTPTTRRVNNITLGKDFFLHYHHESDQRFGIYNLNNLSFAYFISNLLTFVDSNKISYEHHPLYFPLDTKGNYEIFSIKER